MVNSRAFLLLGACFILGMSVFGFLTARAVRLGREFDRYFTVRGLSEREVKATLALWPIQYQTTGETLKELQANMQGSRRIVEDYLFKSGLKPGEISLGLPKIRDTITQRKKDDLVVLPRYQATVSLVVRSRDVDLIKKAILDSETLLEQGVPLLKEEYGSAVEFHFDQVNAIKPEMIAEATANARQAAEKFALDSKAQVGAIRKAMQGIVEIHDRDQATPEIKKVRVVTTIEFFIR